MEASSDKAKSLWSFTDEQEHPWSGAVSIDRVTGQINSYIVSVQVNRIDKKKIVKRAVKTNS